MIYKIEVSIKKNFRERHGEHVRQDIIDSGIKNAPIVKYSQLFKIEGDLTVDEIKTIAGNLLIDPITEKYIILSLNEDDNVNKVNDKHEIEVWLKQGVTDTVADSVIKAVKDLGINKEIKVKTGQKFIFEGQINLPSVKHIAERLLVNSIIQEYKIK